MSRVLVGVSAEIVLDDDTLIGSPDWPNKVPIIQLRDTLNINLREYGVNVTEIKWWVTER